MPAQARPHAAGDRLSTGITGGWSTVYGPEGNTRWGSGQTAGARRRTEDARRTLEDGRGWDKEDGTGPAGRLERGRCTASRPTRGARMESG
jgi:hypothetical protein